MFEGTGPTASSEGIPMDVSLTPDLEALVHSKVESGLYPSAIDAVSEALRLLDERDRSREQRRGELKAAIRIGLEQAERGELLDGREVFEGLRRKIRASGGLGT